MGYSEERTFYSYLMKMPEASSWNNFPTPAYPLTRYKFTSFEINYSPDQQITNRQTYSILDWLGDMGGLLDALYFLGKFLVVPFG